MSDQAAILQSKKTDADRQAVTNTQAYTDAVAGLPKARAGLADPIKADTSSHAP